ncbi:hypothetical protein B0H10DRAFT_2431462 [Mycena sp. CBHHK59/15]|nr:hypothetical protein B0H10DRAFT_2431462 [Mycena sp. CBHHK59/15]
MADNFAYRDDDDDFLYGGGTPQPKSTPLPGMRPPSSTTFPIVIFSQSTSLESLPTGVVAHLEAQAAAEVEAQAAADVEVQAAAEALSSQDTEIVQEDEDDEAVDVDGETEDDEDDVEIIMEPQSRSLDFRQSSSRPSQLRASSSSTAIRAPQPSLTTEYTPIQRAVPPPQSTTPSLATPQAQPAPQPTPHPLPGISEPPPAVNVPQSQPPPQTTAEAVSVDDGVDPSTLPPAPAPPSHPAIDPTVTGTMDGRSIIDVDLSSMVEKQWRRPGSDISDWFNYGFDELSWEAYCYRRRDLGELANVLKTSVLNFSGMPEDQLTVLPPEVRQMVMTGTNAMLNGAANPGMMGQGVMMDMSGMMGPMGMGMNGDMSMNGPMMQGGMMTMQDGSQGQVGNGGTGTPEQHGQAAMMQEGYGGGPAMMNMGMEYGMQDQNQMAQQQLYPQMEAPQPPPPTGPLGRGGAAVPYRGRGLRGARGFAGRGRGRGGYPGDGAPAPVRPTSPLPPNVPTGPRNQNKYKDRDGNAPAVDGLDYGGTNKDGRTTSGEPEERSRKRRSSPSLEDGRGSKRR